MRPIFAESLNSRIYDSRILFETQANQERKQIQIDEAKLTMKCDVFLKVLFFNGGEIKDAKY